MFWVITRFGERLTEVFASSAERALRDVAFHYNLPRSQLSAFPVEEPEED